VVVASSNRFALMREFEQPCAMTVHQMIAELYDGVDWVLVEGFKDSDLLKIEVWRAPTADYPGKPARYMDDDFIVAIATDTPEQLPHATQRPVLDLNDAEAVADYLLNAQDRFTYTFD
jgi:molybdopterin-guanine dinucleotide biosynthesis adapter protein